MQNNKLRVCLVQYDIAWENKTANLSYISHTLALHAKDTDLFVLPEMCNTAFTFATDTMAETTDGNTITQLKELAKIHNTAICGSFLNEENGKFYNKGFIITPGECHFYNKRHLFRMSKESEVLTAGNDRLIISYKDFNICLLVCYDLRFPVWARNRNNEYDLLIYVANWPEGRKEVWNTLLQARAIENMSYVCGVNRVGKDNAGLNHAGQSAMINPRGQKIIELPANKTAVEIVTITKELLTRDRKNFPVWKDADNFIINK